jgi:hypothetical protein
MAPPERLWQRMPAAPSQVRWPIKRGINRLRRARSPALNPEARE